MHTHVPRLYQPIPIIIAMSTESHLALGTCVSICKICRSFSKPSARIFHCPCYSRNLRTRWYHIANGRTYAIWYYSQPIRKMVPFSEDMQDGTFLSLHAMRHHILLRRQYVINVLLWSLWTRRRGERAKIEVEDQPNALLQTKWRVICKVINSSPHASY